MYNNVVMFVGLCFFFQSHYYVNFFDEKASHAWVPITGIRLYRGPEKIVGYFVVDTFIILNFI